MTCASCDSLKARNKTCWRHPVIQPQSLGLEKSPGPGTKALPAPMFSPVRPGPTNGQRATLDALFPAHAGHSKIALAIVSMETRFACDCGIELAYIPGLGMGTWKPAPSSVPLTALFPIGTKIIAIRKPGRPPDIVWEIQKLDWGGNYYCHPATPQPHYQSSSIPVSWAHDPKKYLVIP